MRQLGSVGHAVDRLDRRQMAAGVPPVELLDLALLDVGGIGKHDAREIDRGGRRVDRPAIAVAGELRQKAGVVDMGVAEDDGADLARGEGERAVVQLLLGLRALEHAAIDEKLAVVRLQPEAGAGDATGSAMEIEAERHGREPSVAILRDVAPMLPAGQTMAHIEARQRAPEPPNGGVTSNDQRET